MKFTDFLDERSKALEKFFSCDAFSFKDITIALALDDPSKLIAQRLSGNAFASQTEADGKRKMRRFTGNEMLAFCVAYALVKAQLAHASEFSNIFKALTTGVDPDEEFARSGDVVLSQAPAKAIEVLQLAYPMTRVWYQDKILFVRTPIIDGGASVWDFATPPFTIPSPVTIVLLKDALLPMVTRLSEKYEIPELNGSGDLQVTVVSH